MSEWMECKLGDVAEVQNGYAFKSTEFKEDNGIPVIKIKNVASGKLQMSDIAYYQLPIDNLERFIIRNNDILIAMTGSHINQPSSMVGKVARYNLNAIAFLNQRVGKIYSLDINELDEDFLYYFFKQKEITYELALNAGGSANQANISPTLIKSLDFTKPPLPEQKGIASVLSSLDDKIDLLHRQNKTLEAMAETLFRQWFVEEMKEDWEEVTLGECCRVITKGTTPTTLKKAFVSSGINFIKVNCIDENGNFLADKFEYIDEETNELLSRSKLEEGDILYSIAGTIGRLIIVSKDILPANVNQALAILRINSEKINPVFIKYCLKDREITENLHSKVVHAVQPNLSLGEISKTIVPFPPNELLNDFVRIVEPIESNLLKNKTQIRTLEKLRDTLLPKLMSGEVRVKYDEN